MLPMPNRNANGAYANPRITQRNSSTPLTPNPPRKRGHKATVEMRNDHAKSYRALGLKGCYRGRAVAVPVWGRGGRGSMGRADVINGMRYDANAWDGNLEPGAAAMKCGRPAGFELKPRA